MLPEIRYVKNGELNYALLSMNDLISGAMVRGGFELDLQQISNEILKFHKDGLVLDIGANLGSYTIPIAAHNPNLQIHSFEPQRIVYYQLCTNIILNRLDNVFAHHCGVSDSAWTKQLTVPNYAQEFNIGAFSVDEEVRGPQYEVVTTGATEDITAITLDSLNLKDVRLIKIDVEGHEHSVLQGAMETIKNSNYPPIIFEAWDFKHLDKRDRLYKFITDLGYSITTLGTNNVALKEKQ